MTSAELDARMVLLLEQQRQVVGFHWPDSRLSAEQGWPDWVLLGPGGVLFRCTRNRSGLPAPQIAVGYALQALGLNWAAWTEDDLTAGVIEAQITAISKQGVLT